MKSFKKFWRDYWELFKKSAGFCKKHWIGLIIFSVVYTIIYFAIFFPEVLEILWFDMKCKFKKVDFGSKKETDYECD